MLKQIDEFYKYIMIVLLALYIINSVYFSELIVTFTIIGLAIILEVIRNRSHIRKLTYVQLSIIGVVILAGIAGTIYLLVLFRIFLQPFSLSSTLELILLIVFVLVCLYVLAYFLKKMFGRAIE
ncbi:hypothetical protein [Psychrobacillus vulpis]|uniref:Uncharacterized protein n=1 Tax=Psychrobacillus vulpis TaxID=2325572 RepID=A0A544TNG0_9BACI|nr:hypothetical protein [Psychrobacillus vulpis]TQR18988.1 hypothetical protein FG384_15380 [Psychrobacillus vulpis]